jgi:hypothetical protein
MVHGIHSGGNAAVTGVGITGIDGVDLPGEGGVLHEAAKAWKILEGLEVSTSQSIEGEDDKISFLHGNSFVSEMVSLGFIIILI